MSGINSVKNYKYSILVKNIGVLKRLKKDEKKCAGIGSYTYYCRIQQFTIKATYSAEQSASFIKKEETVEEKVSSGLNILTAIT